MTSAPPITADQLEAAHWLVVGTTGSGKTYLTRGLLEQLRRADRRVGAIDKMGKLWGVTLSVDGTAPGLEFVIFGGKRAQAPMTPDQGARIGQLFVEQNLPAIFDLSQWKQPDRERWVADFSEAVFFANETALHLVFDEAQSWVPNNGGGPAFDAVKLLAEQGRGNGINLLLTAPRLSGVDAGVRGAIAAMVAMRQTGSVDRAKTAELVAGHLAIDEKTFRNELPILPTGTGFVWSPTGAGLERVAFPPNTTFDSSRTPRHGDTPLPPVAVSSKLVEELRAVLAPPSLAAPGGDAAYRQLIAEIDPDAIVRRDARIEELEAIVAYQAAELEHLREVDAECDGYNRGLTAIETLVVAVRSGTWRSNMHSGDADLHPPAQLSGMAAGGQGTGSPPPIADAPERGDADVPHEASDANDKPGAIRGASALQFLASITDGRAPTATEEQWAFLGGFTRSGGTWSTYKGALRAAGLIVENGGRWQATAAGREAVADWDAPMLSVGPDLVRAWAKKGQSTGKLAEVLLKRWPHTTTREALAADAGMTASGGTFTTYLGRLRKRGMLEERGKQLRLNPALMEWQ